MGLSFFSPEVQQAAANEIKARERLRQSALQGATPELAQTVSNIYQRANFLRPSQVIPLAKANASPQTVDFANEQAAKLTTQDVPEAPESWWKRNIYGNLKRASRYTFAALNIFPEAVQNIAANIANDAPGDDFWKSTSLGTMIEDGEKAGSGFFMGGEAAELQAERARKYRGTIDAEGKRAFTIGRASAKLIFDEDSTAYSILSGALDAAVNIGADPTLVFGGKIKALREAKYAIPDTAEDLARYMKAVEESAGDLSKANQAWDGSKFMSWWSTNKAAQRVERNIQDIVDEFTNYKATFDDLPAGVDPESAGVRRARLRNIDIKRNYAAHKIRSEVFDGTITHEAALRMVDGDGVKNVIAEAANRLGGAGTTGEIGLFPTDIRDLTGAQRQLVSKFAESTVYRIPKIGKSLERLAQFAPQAVLSVKGTASDRFKAVQNIERMLDLLGDKLPALKREEIIGRAAQAYSLSTGSPTGIYEVRNVVKDAVATVLRDGYDVPDAAIKKLLKNYDEQFTSLRTRISTEMGSNPGHAYIRGLIDNGLLDEESVIRQVAGRGTTITRIEDLDAKIVSPTVISELLNTVQVLPDPRVLRRLASDPFYKRVLEKTSGGRIKGGLTYDPSGETRGLVETVEFLQNNVWKPLTLMNPGYIARNILDGQFHVALSGEKNLKGMFKNPVAYFMFVMNKRAVEGITGKALTGGTKAARARAEQGLGPASRAEEIFFEAMGRKSMGMVGDPVDAANRVIQNGDYAFVSRLENPENHTLGVLDQLRMVFTDRVLRRAMNTKASPNLYSPELDDMMKYLDDNPEIKSDIVALAKKGYLFGTENGKASRIRPMMNRQQDEDLMLRTWIRTEVFGRAQKWKASPEMRVMAQHNKIPYIDANQSRAVIEDVIPDDEVMGKIISFEGKPGEGTIFRGPDDYGPNGAPIDYVVVGVTRKEVIVNGKPVSREVWESIPVIRDETAWGAVHDPFNVRPYNDFAVQTVNKVYGSVENADNALIPATTGYVVRTNPDDTKGMARVMDKWKVVTNSFFDTIAGGAMEKLEKSPIYRQYYYKFVKENADLLKPEQFDEMIAGIRAGAQRLGISESAYIGGGKREFDNLLKMRASATGEGTVEQLNEWASNRAFISMKGLLFDAAQKRNVDEVLKVLIPFGAAWREVIGKYATQFAADPTNFRKVERVFTGATNVDLEQDGTGFFYKDPQTGQYMFNYPLSDKFSQLFTGLTSPLVAPVKGLSVGLTFMPGVGPVGQIGANALLPFVPKESDFRKVFLPYGTPGTAITDFTPGWMRKTFDALRANPDKMDGIYAQTYVETVRALNATGEYDLSNVDDKERLLNDARGKARVLSLFRAFNQFLGPASGTTKFELDTEQGDTYMAHLVKDFQKMQAEDYDSSVQTFLETYGDDMLLYVSGKSKSEISGLEPTSEFEVWAKQNKSVMSKYKDVAGFFAPGGADFNFQVWKAQVDSGQRERLSASEIIDQAQLMVGSAKYRQARLKFGPYPSREQQAWLREYRKALHSELPGFPEVASFDPSEFPKMIGQLRLAVQEPKLADNDVVKAVQIYLDKRDAAIAQAQAAGFVGLSSRTVAPLREYLASIGEALIEKYPDFKRIYEQKLQAELMQYTEE